MKHVPVLLDEVMSALAVREGGRYVDGTLGRAGHAGAIIARGGLVLGIDRDEQAIEEVAAQGIAGLTIRRGNHGELERIANENGWEEVDGVLLDLGVSSPQLDEAGRGFSFLREGPLDMRMDRSSGLSAADLVNGESEGRLCEIFREWGEEAQAKRIAHAICVAREKGEKFETTTQLAEFVEKLIGRRGAHHPATKVFQALRMEVNHEVDELRAALCGALKILRSGGRCAVITFESITDREVKQFFGAHVGREVALQQGGSEWRGEVPRVRSLSRKPICAKEEETKENPRARSAKLRVIEKE